MDEVRKAFRFLSSVRTPGGIGLVQGYQTIAGGEVRVLVSHEVRVPGKTGPAPLILTAYPVDVLEIMR